MKKNITKTEVKEEVVKVPEISKLVLQIRELDEYNKNLLREELGIRVKVQGSRVGGTVQRTDKKLEIHLCKQMQVLINCLPSKPTTTSEWANLAIKAGLETQQPPERIVAYYKRQIVGLGFAK